MEDIKEYDDQTQEKIFYGVSAIESEINSIDGWLYSSNEKARYNDLLSDYDVNDLFKVVDKEYGMQVLTIVSKTDGNKSLCFSLVSDGSVITSFFTKAYKDDEDNITVEVNDLSSGNEFSFTDYVDGTRKVNYTRDEANLRTLG